MAVDKIRSIFLNNTTKRVELLFYKVEGTAYDPPAGCSMLDLGADVWCSKDAFQQEDGSFAFPPNPDVEPEPTSLAEISAAMTVLAADFTAQLAELQTKLDQIVG